MLGQIFIFGSLEGGADLCIHLPTSVTKGHGSDGKERGSNKDERDSNKEDNREAAVEERMRKIRKKTKRNIPGIAIAQ